MTTILPSSIWNHLKGALVGVHEVDMAVINQFSAVYGVDERDIICALEPHYRHLGEVD